MSKIYIVETSCEVIFKYAVEADSKEEAMALILHRLEHHEELTELFQEHSAEVIDDVYKISQKEYLKKFDEYFDYLTNFDEQQKLTFINKDGNNIAVPEL